MTTALVRPVVEHARPVRFRAPFRADIEGLRAIAVLAVVGYHASIPILPGGFIGVDVFFVISGYLITALLLAEASDTGTVFLRDFYARRARRILPGAAVVLITTSIASYFVFTPLRTRDAAQDLVASALYLGNWRFIQQGTDYLSAGRDPSPAMHFWSLGVEEQFYLVWPMLVLGVCALAITRARRFLALMAISVGVVAVGSFALSLYWTTTSPTLAYMASPTRAWQFAAGAAIALAYPALQRFSTWSATRRAGRILTFLVGWTGLAGLVLACVLIDHSTPYPGLAALLPTLSAVLVILAGSITVPARAAAGRILQVRPMRAIGRLSYAWYLWHWPALVLTESVVGTLTWQLRSLVMVASAVPAFLTLRLVERPIRFSPTILRRPSSGLSVGLTATVASVVCALTVGAVVTARAGSVQSFASVPTLASVFDPATSALSSGDVSPNPLDARQDRPRPDSCILQHGVVSGPPCEFGAASGPLMVLFGDSHAQQWQPALERLAITRGWRLKLFTKASCPAASLPAGRAGEEYSTEACAEWRTNALKQIGDLRPALVVVSSFSRYELGREHLASAWARTLDALRRATPHILYIRDTPFAAQDTPACMSGALEDWSKCSFPRSDALTVDPVQQAALLGQEPHVTVADFTNYLCPDTMCPAVRSGVLLYRDESHLTATAVAVLEPAVAQVLDAQNLMPAAN